MIILHICIYISTIKKNKNKTQQEQIIHDGIKIEDLAYLRSGHSTSAGHRGKCPSNCIFSQLLCFQI